MLTCRGSSMVEHFPIDNSLGPSVVMRIENWVNSGELLEKGQSRAELEGVGPPGVGKFSRRCRD